MSIYASGGNLDLFKNKDNSDVGAMVQGSTHVDVHLRCMYFIKLCCLKIVFNIFLEVKAQLERRRPTLYKENFELFQDLIITRIRGLINEDWDDKIIKTFFKNSHSEELYIFIDFIFPYLDITDLLQDIGIYKKLEDEDAYLRYFKTDGIEHLRNLLNNIFNTPGVNLFKIRRKKIPGYNYYDFTEKPYVELYKLLDKCGPSLTFVFFILLKETIIKEYILLKNIILNENKKIYLILFNALVIRDLRQQRWVNVLHHVDSFFPDGNNCINSKLFQYLFFRDTQLIQGEENRAIIEKLNELIYLIREIQDSDSMFYWYWIFSRCFFCCF